VYSLFRYSSLANAKAGPLSFGGVHGAAVHDGLAEHNDTIKRRQVRQLVAMAGLAVAKNATGGQQINW
jgi:hypothetical protein